MKSLYQKIKERFRLPPIKKLCAFWNKLEQPIPGEAYPGQALHQIHYHLDSRKKIKDK